MRGSGGTFSGVAQWRIPDLLVDRLTESHETVNFGDRGSNPRLPANFSCRFELKPIIEFMNCENCNQQHDGTYGSGRFCNELCARSFSSKAKRKEINEKVSKVLLGRPSHKKGKAGTKHSQETREKISESIRSKFLNLTAEELAEKERRLKRRNVEGVMAYRARKYAATPTDADRKLIQEIYDTCPEGYHVDHIQALSRGGLHHQDNLQYLPISENCKKCADREYDKSLAISWKTIIKQQ